jgi:hypothetical protein
LNYFSGLLANEIHGLSFILQDIDSKVMVFYEVFNKRKKATNVNSNDAKINRTYAL